MHNADQRQMVSTVAISVQGESVALYPQALCVVSSQVTNFPVSTFAGDGGSEHSLF